jgi:hypothetical protein
LLKFLQQNCSIFDNSCTINPNTSKPPPCTHQVLANNTKSMARDTIDFNVTNKRNKLPTLMDRWLGDNLSRWWFCILKMSTVRSPISLTKWFQIKANLCPKFLTMGSFYNSRQNIVIWTLI